MKNIRPTKAVLLAAGFGTRLLPLTREVPKPLLPLWGRTMFDHALDTLVGFGVGEVLINLHHGAEAIRSHLAKYPRADLQIQFSFEPEILGTGGALVRARHFLPDDKPFWLFNADVIADLDPQPLLNDFARQQPLATLWLVKDDGPKTVEMKEGRIRTLNSPHAGQPDLFTFSGLHLLSKRILNFLPKQERYASITAAYAEALQHGAVVRGVPLDDALWADVGTPMQYLAAHGLVQQRHARKARGARLFDPVLVARAAASGAEVAGCVALADDVRVGPDVRLTNCVVLPGAQIGPGVALESVVVGAGVEVRRDAFGLVGRADRWLDDVESWAARRVGFDLPHTTVECRGERGSQRTFFRLLDGARTAMLMRYDPAREENTLFARHARYLRRIGVPVPEILLDWPRHRLCLTSDLGPYDLLGACRGLPLDRVVDLYERVLRVVIVLHTRGTFELGRARVRRMPDFGPDLYRWERNYFAEHMLAKRCGLPAAEITKIKRELVQMSWRLDAAPQVLLHRDLQSTNVLLKDGAPHLIDFQGMRLGAATYDLASLLCDPYMDLPDDVQTHLLDYYNFHVGHEVWVGIIGWAAVQRLAQALGAFARLSAQPGLAFFADHIPTALRQLCRALDSLPDFPALRRWAEAEQTLHQERPR